MLRCVFGWHGSPIRERIDLGTVRWICPRCDGEIGQSAYPASETFQKRQIAAQTKCRLLAERKFRVIRRA